MDYVKLNVQREDRQKFKTFAAQLDISLVEAFNVAINRMTLMQKRLADKPDSTPATVLQAIIEGDQE